MPTNARALHWVFKIGSRTKTIDFYLNILNMQILRHEEFEEGCDAACNGPYDGKWSKTMVGYGDEDNNFVVELTYNYGIRSYELGNDFNYLFIKSNQAIESIKNKNYPHTVRSDESYEIKDPNGYTFLVAANDSNVTTSKLIGLSLHCSNIQNSTNYWSNILKGKVESQTDSDVSFSFDSSPFRLNLLLSKEPVNHAKAFGRVAFSCPTDQLKPLQEEMDKLNLTILTRFIELKTPGKADVCVVILADPDGHEICWVGDEGFRELSKFDPKARGLLDEAILNDKSDEWHEKKNKKNASN